MLRASSPTSSLSHSEVSEATSHSTHNTPQRHTTTRRPGTTLEDQRVSPLPPYRAPPQLSSNPPKTYIQGPFSSSASYQPAILPTNRQQYSPTHDPRQELHDLTHSTPTTSPTPSIVDPIPTQAFQPHPALTVPKKQHQRAAETLL